MLGEWVLFSLLMADRKYEAAEKTLDDAETYAETTDDDKVNLQLQRASLLVSQAEHDPEKRDDCFKAAEELLEKKLNIRKLTGPQAVLVLQTLAEVSLKAENYKKAIACADYTLNGLPPVSEMRTESSSADRGNAANREVPNRELTPDELDERVKADMARIQEKIDTGELSDDLGQFAEMEYDEDGNLVPKYDDTLFAVLNEEDDAAASGEERFGSGKADWEVTREIRDKAYFTMLSAYLGLEDFAAARQYGDALKSSPNVYYKYYGIYTSAMIAGKLKESSAEYKYAEAIAFFRNKAVENHEDVLSVIFRARLYAEQGKYEKASELASLLSEEDQKSLKRYIDQCKNS
ncbi:MAG: hypothetical protein U0L49_00300 [Eubacterium sp.]|nr:hypothetical protein [Eubacterium sp.]